MWAFKFLKAYCFFTDGFISNLSLHDCASDSLRLVYVRLFVQLSLLADLLLETVVALNCEIGMFF